MESELTPQEIVAKLNQYVVGHEDAKRSVAVALRNRWRRLQVPSPMQEEILPKNILMIGSTGIGKTEIARRLAKISNAPFIKVEATKFTEIGYVGRDVEQIIKDLLEIAIQQAKQDIRHQYDVVAESIAIQKIARYLIQQELSEAELPELCKEIMDHKWDDIELEVNVPDNSFDLYGHSKILPFGEWLNRAFSSESTVVRFMNVKEAIEYIATQESEKMIDYSSIVKDAITNVEHRGIVFLDEIDKICGYSKKQGLSEVSREGVQRDLLPLVEGTTVSTKYGNVKTDHILFIASGAFHSNKPSELLPELQGRLPIRIEMKPLEKEDFVKILSSTENNLKKQSIALLETEGLSIIFTDSAIEEIAEKASEMNRTYENIGARRLATLLESVLEDLSFNAADYQGQTITIDDKYVSEKISSFLKKENLSHYIL